MSYHFKHRLNIARDLMAVYGIAVKITVFLSSVVSAFGYFYLENTQIDWTGGETCLLLPHYGDHID